MVVHRANIGRISEMVDLALALGRNRIEIAHVQYHGWALKNRGALMPTAEQVSRAAAEVEELRRKHHGRIVIDAVVPEITPAFRTLRRRMGPRSLNVTPSGRVLPCHAAESIPGLEFWNVRRAFACRHLGEFAGLQRLPRHRFPAGLRHATARRFRRLPLPGLRPGRGPDRYAICPDTRV